MRPSREIIDLLSKKDSINLTIRNNTAATVTANILGKPNLADNSNALDKYLFNLTGETFAVSSFTIQYRATAQASFQTLTVALPTQSIQGLADALTGIGLGSWYVVGDTVITYNDNYVWGDLVIGSASYPGEIDNTFVSGTGFNGDVFAIAQQSDGKLVCGGTFTSYNGTGANRIVRLNTDGSVDGSFVYGVGFDNAVNDILIQPDGYIVVAGNFTSYNGAGISYITRLDSGGVVDPGFSTGVGFSSFINSIARQSDGKLVVVGNFNTGAGSVRIARLNTNGTEDLTLVTGTGFSNQVTMVKIDSGGNIVASGGFTLYNGNAAARLARISTLGVFDATLNIGTGFDSNVDAFAIDASGNLICVGSFTDYNGTGANGIIRISTLGVIDGTFVYGTGFNGSVFDVMIDSASRILVVGDFTTYDAGSDVRIVRILTTGAVDSSFITGTGLNGATSRIIQQSDSKLVAVGQFTTYDGDAAPGIVRISS